MARKQQKRGLGRGLSALLGDAEVTELTQKPSSRQSNTTPQKLPVSLLQPNADQPRRNVDDAELEELAASIRAHGVIQPVIVRPHPTQQDNYQIVAGERRWRAAQRAQIHDVPVIVRDLDDRDVLELAIVENIQRVDLNPIDESHGYAELIERFDYTQEALAKVMGKSRSHIANALRLRNLPEQVQRLVRSGKLSAGHARALITAADPVALAEKAVLSGMTVRQLEDLARKSPEAQTISRRHPKAEKDADTRQLEGDLSAAIGMKVSIEHLAADGSGEVRIRYRDLDQLDNLCRKLGE